MACRLIGAESLSEPMLIRTLGTNFSEILIEIHIFSLNKIHLKMLSAKCPFCLGLSVLTASPIMLDHKRPVGFLG